MAFTRKMLKALGIEDEKVDQIIEAHIEVVDGLKEKLKTAEADAEKLADAEKQLEGLKNGTDYKAKYEAEHKAFEDYKKEQVDKEQHAAKEAAARAYFEGKGITGTNLEIAMKGAKDEIKALELDGDKIKDDKALADLVGGTYAGLVVSQSKKGADVAKPPANNGGTLKTKDEIYARDEHGRFKLDDIQRQQALSQLMNEKGKV